VPPFFPPKNGYLLPQKGYYVGVHATLGANGVERIIEFGLDAEEKAALDNSVNAVKGLVEDMERMGF